MTDPDGSGSVVNDGSVAGSSIPANTGNVTPTGDEFKVPEEYVEKGWTKDLKTYEDLWKKSDGAQVLIGQKALPDENSTPEQWDTFYKSTGRPDESKIYNFNREGMSETFKKSQNEEYDNAVKSIFHEAGLNQKQVDVIQPKVEKLAETILTEKAKQDAEADTAFDELANKTFGTDRDQILADSKKLLEELTPAGFGEKIAGLDNETLVILSGVLKNVQDKYISEDGSGGKGNAPAGETIDDLRQKARNLMQSDEYRDPFNSKSAEKRKEVQDVYEKIARLSSTA